jgi:AhpD family alkylhydroperoxidase
MEAGDPLEAREEQDGRTPRISKTVAGRTSNMVAEGRSRVQPSIECANAVPEAIEAMRGLDAHVERSGLEPELVELVKIRASQINGCAYCIDIHTRDARVRRESEQRLYALVAWWATPF